MKTVKDATGTPYEAAKHFGVFGLQKFIKGYWRVSKRLNTTLASSASTISS